MDVPLGVGAIRSVPPTFSQLNPPRCQPTLLARIPPEVRTMIFVLSLPEVDSFHGFKRASLTEAPLNISHVCRSWRNMGLATPAIWTRLWFVRQEEENWSISATKSALSALHAFLKRSGNCGLRILISVMYYESQRGDLEDLVQMMDAIVAVQHRWEYTSIRSSQTVWSQGFINNRNWSLNRLGRIRDLSFILDRVHHNEFLDIPMQPFDLDVSYATGLGELTLIDGSEYATQLRVNENVHLPKLERLYVKCGSIISRPTGTNTLDTTLKLLECASSLGELRLELPMSGIQAVGGLRTVYHIPSLHSLRLSLVIKGPVPWEWSLHQIQDVIRHLDLPSLQYFELDLSDRVIVQVFTDLVQMLRRSNARVKSVYFLPASFGVEIEQGAISRLFEGFPSLEKLVDGLSYDPYSLFESLTVDPNKTTLLPNLRILGVYELSGDDDFYELGECLLSRSPSDGENYPTQIDDDETVAVGRSVVPEQKSRSGTSILSKLSITNWGIDNFITLEDLLEDEVIAGLYARGLVIDIDQGDPVVFDGGVLGFGDIGGDEGEDFSDDEVDALF